MRQIIRYIFIFVLLTFFFQCSSVRKAGIVADQTGSTAASESRPDRDVENAGGKELTPDSVTQEITTVEAAMSDSLLLVAPLLPDTTNLVTLPDSTILTTDSLSLMPADSTVTMVAQDTVPQKQTLQAAVFYTAQDSIIFTGDNMGYLYGDAI